MGQEGQLRRVRRSLPRHRWRVTALTQSTRECSAHGRPSTDDTPPTHARSNCRRLSVASVVAPRNAPCFDWLKENIFGSFPPEPRRHCCGSGTCGPKVSSFGKPRAPAVSGSIKRTATALLARSSSFQPRQQLQPETNSKLNLW